MALPKRISPCPIHEAVVEALFVSDIPPDAIFGLVYNVFKDDYEKIEKLAILQLPEEIRSVDPNLIHKPHYKFTADNFIFQIGPRVFSLSHVYDYTGWDDFYPRIEDTGRKIKELGLVKSFTRLGIRYINFFEDNIFEKIEINVTLGDKDLGEQETYIKSDFPGDPFTSKIRITNKTEIKDKDGEPKVGSIFDIDTIFNKPATLTADNILDVIQEGHIEEKTKFFSILKDDYIAQLNPEY